MIELPKEVVAAFDDPDTIKVLTTTDEVGNPHTVFKYSMVVREDGQLAFLELLERSRTYKNMLRNHWLKKKVAVSIFNPKTGLAYQNKGYPTRCIIEGDEWVKFRADLWEQMPDIEPAALWYIGPEEVLDESVEGRFKEEKSRIIQLEFWNIHQRRSKYTKG
ncbi:MAG: hypothetical protein JRJ20_06665 [Deltaproteobacteria bacterium]|nr:hypothetical protein [Deltaproteobacteria bacterium]